MPAQSGNRIGPTISADLDTDHKVFTFEPGYFPALVKCGRENGRNGILGEDGNDLLWTEISSPGRRCRKNRTDRGGQGEYSQQGIAHASRQGLSLRALLCSGTIKSAEDHPIDEVEREAQRLRGNTSLGSGSRRAGIHVLRCAGIDLFGGAWVRSCRTRIGYLGRAGVDGSLGGTWVSYGARIGHWTGGTQDPGGELKRGPQQSNCKKPGEKREKESFEPTGSRKPPVEKGTVNQCQDNADAEVNQKMRFSID